MHWYLVHTKPRQEKCALENLERQGFECHLPTFSAERLRRGSVVLAEEPLFPRYLFIRLGVGESAQSWAPIRSTKGVSRIVCFGLEPAKVSERLVEELRSREAVLQSKPEKLFKPGDRVRLTEAPFAEVEGIFQMADGARRAMVLIELLSKQVRVQVTPASLRKIG